MKPRIRLGLAGALAVAVTSAFFGCAQQPTQSSDSAVPRYQVDATWLKPLKDNWIFGQVTSVAVDKRDHV